jgi:hypothetical protein
VQRSAFADALWTPLDAARSGLLRLAAPWVAPLFADRERRVLWLGVVSVASAFVLTGVAPLWLLAFGPLLLGVPHLVADVRYLVVKPGLHRDGWLMAGLSLPLAATTLGAGPLFGVLAALVAVLLARRTWRTPIALVVVAALAACAWDFPDVFQLAFVHLHNLVALALWFVLRPRPASHAWIPALAVVGAGAILTGALDPVVTTFGGWVAPIAGVDFGEFVSTHTEGLEPTLAARAVLSFCFLQSVHYAVWLRLIPDDARERRAPRTFRASWCALVHDLGVPALLLALTVAVGIAAWGLLEVSAARDATFHGYLELAIAARWFTEGRRG